MNICVLKGDGIGPEVTNEAVQTLGALCPQMNFSEHLIGGAAIDSCGIPLPEESLEAAQKSDAVLLGAVGGWKYDALPPEIRPEKALLKIRKELGLFNNLRPIKVYDALLGSSPLRAEIAKGTDIMIVRELLGGLYFGEPRKESPESALNTMAYSKEEIRRIALDAFGIARKRSKKLCSVDKANVLEVSRLWRKTVIEVAKDFPEVELSHLYVDNAAMQLVLNPRQFDVLLTENLFGDILSDEAAVLAGSLGMLPSASLNGKGFGMYEPCHGSAPDLAGKDCANPLAAILSAAMMLRHSLGQETEALRIEKAVEDVLNQGYRTADLGGGEIVGTKRMGQLVRARL